MCKATVSEMRICVTIVLWVSVGGQGDIRVDEAHFICYRLLMTIL